MPDKRRCQGVTGQGEQCKAWAMKGQNYCWFHSPDKVDERRAVGGNTRRGPDKKPRRQSHALDSVERFLDEYTGPGGVARFLEQYYVLEDGRLIVLEDWEREILSAIYDTKRDDGRRQYTEVLIGLPRKCGKSTLAAGVGFYELIVGGMRARVEQQLPPEIYSCATDFDQAAIVFDKASKAIRRSQFAVMCKVLASSIEVERTGAKYTVLSADAPSAFGLNPSLVLFDEVGLQPDRRLWDAMSTAGGARPEPLVIGITTAGPEPSGIGFELYQRLSQGEDPEGYCFWSSGDAAEANIASWITEEYLASERRRLPTNVYQRLHENKWVRGAASLLSPDIVDGIFDSDVQPLNPYRAWETSEYSLIYACDLGLRRDRTASVMGWWDTEEQRLVIKRIRVWRPEDFAGGEVIISEVGADMIDMQQVYGRHTIVVDPWQLAGLRQDFEREGYPIEDFTFSEGSVRKLSQQLFNLCQDRRLKSVENDVFRSELNDLQSVDSRFGWRLQHASGKHDDVVMATGMLTMVAEQGAPLLDRRAVAKGTLSQGRRGVAGRDAYFEDRLTYKPVIRNGVLTHVPTTRAHENYLERRRRGSDILRGM